MTAGSGVLVLGGFLGSGKTTLLLEIIEHVKRRSDKDVPVAVLENEIGSVGIDDQVLKGKGYAVTNMLSRCACCTLSGDLPRAVRDIQDDLDPDLLVVEATGLAIPQDMKANLRSSLSLDARVCTLVDAFRWRRMLVPLQALLRQQLRGADVICVNKVDLVDQAELGYVFRTLDDLAPSVARVPLSAGTGVPAEAMAAILGERHGRA